MVEGLNSGPPDPEFEVFEFGHTRIHINVLYRKLPAYEQQPPQL